MTMELTLTPKHLLFLCLLSIGLVYPCLPIINSSRSAVGQQYFINIKEMSQVH